MIGYVYGIRFGPYLKVGFSIHPGTRIRQLNQIGRQKTPIDVLEHSAVPIFAVRGDLTTERLILTMLKPWHAHGEWFRYEDQVADLCETLLTTNHDFRFRHPFRLDGAGPYSQAVTPHVLEPLEF